MAIGYNNALLAQQFLDPSIMSTPDPAVSSMSTPNMSLALPPAGAAPTEPPKPKFDYNKAFSKVVTGEGGLGNKVNPDTGAAGAFGLMPDQAKALGVKPEELTAPADQQRETLFPRYLKSHGLAPDDIHSETDMALAVAAPSWVKRADRKDDDVVYKKGSDEAVANKHWQTPSGDVTVGSLKKYYKAEDTGDAAPKSAADKYNDYLTAGGPASSTTISRSTNEGVPYTDEDKAKLEANKNTEVAANENASLSVTNELAKQRADLLDQQQKQQERADTAEGRKWAAEQHYNDAKGRVATAVQAVQDDQAPKPFGGNVFSGILATIGMALGAYGASITKTRNFAADMINQMLDRDMASWKEKHLDLKYKADTEKDLTHEQWLEFKSTEAEHKQEQNALVLKQLEIRNNGTQNAEEQKRLGLVKSNIEARYNNTDLEMQRLSREHAATTVTTQQAGGGGPDLETINKREETARNAGVPLETREAGRAAAHLPPRVPLNKEQQGQAEKLAKELEGLTGAEEEVHQALDVLGKKGHEPPGTGISGLVPDWAYSIAQRLPGTGLADSASKALGGEGNMGERFAAARQNKKLIENALTIGVVETVGKGHVGIERNLERVEKLRPHGVIEADDARAYLETTLKQINARKKTFLSGVDDEAVRRQIEEGIPSYAPTENAKPYQPGAP